MNLFELCGLAIETPKATVPVWTLGCFRRRSITFHTGVTDAETEVIWLQSGGLTADLRIHSGRPTLSDRRALSRCDAETLVRLSESEGGLAHTRWDGERMHWLDWTAFQTHAKWPEPGILRRVGDCLVEFAPSGAYVEDWRFQPAGIGPLIGLELIDEIDVSTGQVRHLGGGLVLCGEHAAFVRGRAAPIEDPIADFVRTLADDPGKLDRLFGFEASYGRASTGGFLVTRSTSPWREGQSLLALDGFSYDAAAGLVCQRVPEDGTLVDRRFRVDTLEARFDALSSTEVDPEGRAWLEREQDTLLRSARR